MSTIDQIYFPRPAQPVGKPAQPAKPQAAQTVGETPFSKVLDQTQGVRFSQHAQDRLKARNISFSADQLQQLERGGKQCGPERRQGLTGLWWGRQRWW
jgi:hypothetical protein